VKYEPTHQGRVKSGALDAYAGIGVLVRRRVGSAVDADASRVLQGRQPGLVVLARADALPRHGVRHQGSSRFATLRRTRGRSSTRWEGPRHPRRAAGAEGAAPGGGRGARVRRRLAGHQQLQKRKTSSRGLARYRRVIRRKYR
jgi:hypothetical protein